MAENILHFAGYRIRVKGSGVLRATMKGLDNVVTETLQPLTLSSSPGLQPTTLSNFQGQRGLLRLETTSIDETFDVNRIVLFVKELWTSYPG